MFACLPLCLVILNCLARLGSLSFGEHLLLPWGSRAYGKHEHSGLSGNLLRPGVSGPAAAWSFPSSTSPHMVAVLIWPRRNFMWLLPADQTSSGSPQLWVSASLALVLCLCRFLHPCFLGVPLFCCGTLRHRFLFLLVPNLSEP